MRDSQENSFPRENSFAAAAAIAIPGLLFGGSFALAARLESYSHLSQTVSEIGRIGSVVQLPWTLLGVAISTCFVLFGAGLVRISQRGGVSTWPAFLLTYFGIVHLGLAVFSAPHALHNVFGLALTPAYFTPLVAWLCWRRKTAWRPAARFSLACGLLVVLALLLNLSPLVTRDLFPLEYYGLVQRSLFFSFHGLWCGGMGVLLLGSGILRDGVELPPDRPGAEVV